MNELLSEWISMFFITFFCNLHFVLSEYNLCFLKISIYLLTYPPSLVDKEKTEARDVTEEVGSSKHQHKYHFNLDFFPPLFFTRLILKGVMKTPQPRDSE